jgi:hypothetical protein
MALCLAIMVGPQRQRHTGVHHAQSQIQLLCILAPCQPTILCAACCASRPAPANTNQGEDDVVVEYVPAPAPDIAGLLALAASSGGGDGSEAAAAAAAPAAEGAAGEGGGGGGGDDAEEEDGEPGFGGLGLGATPGLGMGGSGGLGFQKAEELTTAAAAAGDAEVRRAKNEGVWFDAGRAAPVGPGGRAVLRVPVGLI